MIRKLIYFCALASVSASLRGYAESYSEELQGCSYSSTCTASGVTGVCVSISGGCCSGTVTSGLCAGSSDIKCCTNNPCSTPYGSGTCMQTSLCSSKGGQSYGGYCTGPSDVQCCVKGTTTSEYGLDLYPATSVSTFQCMINAGFTFVIPRGYRSNGQVDSNVCTNLNNAKTAGMTKRDVYIFPCPKCSKTATTQMTELVNYVRGNCNSAWSGRVWLDIEGSDYWLGSSSSNKAWYEEMVKSCSSLGVSCGVYTNKSQWESIFGTSSYVYGNNLPLWYAHYDNSPTFSDFSAFGGWSTPHAKQYAGDVTVCSTDVDKNYATSW